MDMQQVTMMVLINMIISIGCVFMSSVARSASSWSSSCVTLICALTYIRHPHWVPFFTPMWWII